MNIIEKNNVKYRIVPHVCGGNKHYTVQYYGTEKVFKDTLLNNLKELFSIPMKYELKTGWFDVEEDRGDVQFCLMLPIYFKSEKKAKKWILK